MTADELQMPVEKSLDGILGMLYHNAPSGIHTVEWNFVEQVMLDKLRKDVIGEALNAHVTKLFHTDAASDRF